MDTKENDQALPTFLTSFTKANSQMVATNDNTYKGLNDYWHRYTGKYRVYTKDEVVKIIESGSVEQQKEMSRAFFAKDGIYRQIVLYYATLLKYVGLLIPNPSFGKNLSTPHIAKRYYQALDYVDKMNIAQLSVNCARRAIVDGCYYGVIVNSDKNGFCVLDLPPAYCETRFKDFSGNDIIEFDVTYFNTIIDEELKKRALKIYPKVISKAYEKWKDGKTSSHKVFIPSDLGVCFPFFDSRPLFLQVIPASMDYDDAIGMERLRDLEEIRKIIVQKIPHLSDGRLLFEPEEALEIHKGTVGMMKNNENVSVLTTYADVDAIVSKTTSDTTDATLERMLQNVYSKAGVSSQVFAATGSSTLESSTKFDTALMMIFANKVSNFITFCLNKLFANGNINFKYEILPITYQNDAKYADETFKLASSGYSYLLPALAVGLTQKDIVNVKDLENDVLLLGEKLRPLSSAFNSSGDQTGSSDAGVGRPKKEQEEKAEKTIQNEESLDKVAEEGGSN